MRSKSVNCRNNISEDKDDALCLNGCTASNSYEELLVDE